MNELDNQCGIYTTLIIKSEIDFAIGTYNGIYTIICSYGYYSLIYTHLKDRAQGKTSCILMKILYSFFIKNYLE